MSNDICCFCLQEISSSSTTLTCKHTFHTICIRQYNNNICPLCRGDKVVQNEHSVNTIIPLYKDNDIIWAFGSFVSSVNNRNNIIYKIDRKQLSSGYFWRLYNDECVQFLEKAYTEYLADNTKNITKIDIGSAVYEIQFDGFTITKTFAFPHYLSIQENINGLFRPVIRAKWKDISKNLLVIGIHDMLFFPKIYVFTDDEHIFLFDIDGQQKINDCYEDKSNNKIICIDDVLYNINTEQNTMNNNTKQYIIRTYKKDDYCENY